MSKKINKKMISLFVLLPIFIGFIFIWLIYVNDVKIYQSKKPTNYSAISELLSVFYYNQSQHQDPVKGCWYDSGDYVVFLQRNVESLFYLSLGYKYSNNEQVKKELKSIIDGQLVCAEGMIEKNYKQFRDQKSHGSIYLTPTLNNWLTPQNFYHFEANEGKDVFLLLSLIYANINENQRSLDYQKRANNTTLATKSTNCCEEGPLVLDNNQLSQLQSLVDNNIKQQEIWGSRYSSLNALKQKNYTQIRNILYYLDQQWFEAQDDFFYIGGNYDLAGFISLERLYYKQTGDDHFWPMSQKIYQYLHKNNRTGVDFSNYSNIFHPCNFLKACQLNETLINGIDEKGFMDIARSDPWRFSEVQLVGQAQYILAYILYNNL